MIKKSISKIRKIFNKNLIQKSKVILLGIILASLFLPVFSNKTVSAEGCNIAIGSVSFPRGVTAEVKSSKPIIKIDPSISAASQEKFDVYLNLKLDDTLGLECDQTKIKDYVFYLRVAFDGELSYLGSISSPITATFYNNGSGNKYGFHALVKNVNITDIIGTDFYGNTNRGDKIKIFGSFYKKGSAVSSSYSTDYIGFQAVTIQYNASGSSSIVSLPTAPEVTLQPNSNANSGEVVDYTKVSYKIIPDKDGKGLRSKYRVAWSDGDLNFGITNGLDGVYMEWGGSELKQFQQFTLPKKDNSSGFTFEPYYIGSSVYFNYFDKVKNNTYLACTPTWLGTDCSNVVFRASDGSNKGAGAKSQINLPNNFEPVLKKAAWANGVTVPSPEVIANGNDGKVLGQNDFAAIPAIGGVSKTLTGVVPVDIFGVIGNVTGLVDNSVIVLAGAGKLQKFTVEVYANEKDIILACKNDSTVTDKSQCDNPAFARYGFASGISQTTTSNEKTDAGAISNLFDFVRKIIAYIVLLLTSFIYWIFATILVPVLVALIQIHPYKDEFVNFVYPGWIIIRNLTNIFFIIALLFMGLKILFQQEDASKSRGFIVTLILMALLVNFSLVIAQGIVAIADTVQAQFLPENSKVIETLGHKLMVDPIIVFRGGDSSLTSGGNFTAESTASDLPKAIVLLVLSVAAFFSFVALAAFMFVRIVALWLLYMVSPIAYVLRILPETKSYSSKWWKDFLKYAFNVPILAFFLNIAALVAVTFSAQTGDQVQVQGARGFILGSTAAGLAEFVLTVVSHFVVLIFLFAGMGIATSIGGAGAKKIVDTAKKGFDWALRSAPKLATDFTADKLASTKFAKSRPNLERAIRSIARPIVATKAIKKGYFDEPHKEMNKRFDKTFTDMSNRIQPYGEDKAFPAKWLWWKLKGQDTKSLLNQAEKLNEEASIKNDTDIAALSANLTTERNNRRDSLNELSSFLGDRMNTKRARGYVNEMADKAIKMQQEIEELDDKITSPNTGANARARLTAEKTAKQASLATLQGQGRRLNTAVTAAESAGAVDLDISGLHGELSAVVDLSKFQKQLQDAIDQADTNIRRINKEIGDDSDLRKKYGRTSMNDADRTKLLTDAQELTKTAIERERPISSAIETQEAEAAKEEQKKLSDLDYDQLSAGFEKALKSNNIAAARAHIKQLADNGDLKDLLESKGLKNNVEDLAKLVKDNFGKAPNRTQVAIIRDLSNSSAKNGNNALAMAVKSLAGGGGMLRDIKTQQSELPKGKIKNIYESKKSDLSFTDKDGKEKFNNGVKDMIDSYNTEDKAKKVKQDLDKKTADHILKVARMNNITLGTHIAAALKDVQAKP